MYSDKLNNAMNENVFENFIKPLDVEEFIRKHNAQIVTSAKLFIKEGKNPIPDPRGLYSPDIFGIPEDEQAWRTRYGYIQLPIQVLHPIFIERVFFRTAIFIDFFRKPKSIIVVSKDGEELHFYESVEIADKDIIQKTQKYIIIDNPRTLFHPDVLTLICVAKAKEGSKFFAKLLNIINKYGKEKMFINRLIVVPAAFRAYTVSPDGKISVDELTERYIDVIQKAQAFTNDRVSAFNLLKAIHNVITIFVKPGKFLGKTGALRQKIASKRINFSARSVITPNPNLRADEIGIPFRVAIELFLPELIHHLLRYHANDLDTLGIPRKVVDIQKTLRKIARGYMLNPKVYDDIVNLIVKVLKEEVLPKQVVVFKRDPVIHEHSFLAARPVLNENLEDNTFRIHPLYCPPLGADFDGDSSLCDVKLCCETHNEQIIEWSGHISEIPAQK